MTDGRTRLAWGDLPASVRGRIGDILGGPVVHAVTQRGGYSPGSADRVVTAAGRQAFVKAASPAVNPDTPGIHRREAAVTALLPAGVPAPALIGVVDDGEWIALVLEDVEARHPSTPWRDAELDAVFDALHRMGAVSLQPDAALPDLAELTAGMAESWSLLAGIPDLPRGLGAWVGAHGHELTDAAARAAGDVRGESLVHFDTRADNLLLRPDGSVVLIDWPWAARGVGWFDALALLINVRLFDPAYDVDGPVSRHPVFSAMPSDAATRVLAALGGHFLEMSSRPEPIGLPTLRRFQRDQAVVALEWVRERGLD